ncbi:sensor histidine kinase [Pseudonocardia sp. TRM90224]|uniref:sensor histidine kinase n=1 Tax=Pseudonocardia sp. TRM90224 TaxID=2812678 RepID=UPI001E44BFD6|nr:sensor histidine kinase [Pseudonocardia sp. TRM90224]
MTDIAPERPPQSTPLRAGTRFGRGFAFLLGGLPLCIVAFVLAVVGFSVGVSTSVIWIGVPILVLALQAARGLATVERRGAEWATGRPLPPHHYREPKGTGLGRLFSRLRDPQSWRDLLHAVVAFPVRLAAFIISVAWFVGGLGGALYVTWQWSLPRDDDDGGGLYWLLTGSRDLWGEITTNTVLGVFMLATSPLLVRGLVAVRAGLARGLLTNQTAALRARATQLESSRRAAVHAEAQTLRRIERDIHDGPQQRLVRLNMDLEAVTRRLDDNPEKARTLVEEALEQSREALNELRVVSRGIAPPILADRGLGAALAAAAARCPIEVSLDVAVPQGKRLAEAVENTAYFVVTESLTNVAKHSQASLCTVQVSTDAQRLLVQVRDNGVGGAHLGKGHGLAGLADRLATVEGVLDVVSPPGGPTVLTAEIPLAGVDS